MLSQVCNVLICNDSYGLCSHVRMLRRCRCIPCICPAEESLTYMPTGPWGPSMPGFPVNPWNTQKNTRLHKIQWLYILIQQILVCWSGHDCSAAVYSPCLLAVLVSLEVLSSPMDPMKYKHIITELQTTVYILSHIRSNAMKHRVKIDSDTQDAAYQVCDTLKWICKSWMWVIVVQLTHRSYLLTTNSWAQWATTSTTLKVLISSWNFPLCIHISPENPAESLIIGLHIAPAAFSWAVRFDGCVQFQQTSCMAAW